MTEVEAVADAPPLPDAEADGVHDVERDWVGANWRTMRGEARLYAHTPLRFVTSPRAA